MKAMLNKLAVPVKGGTSDDRAQVGPAGLPQIERGMLVPQALPDESDAGGWFYQALPDESNRRSQLNQPSRYQIERRAQVAPAPLPPIERRALVLPAFRTAPRTKRIAGRRLRAPPHDKFLTAESVGG